MKKKHTYFSPTTREQRHLLFMAWEETGSVTEACAKAHVSRQTFYNWKARYEEGGYRALNGHARQNRVVLFGYPDRDVYAAATAPLAREYEKTAGESPENLFPRQRPVTLPARP